jgi:uncharacterized protein
MLSNSLRKLLNNALLCAVLYALLIILIEITLDSFNPLLGLLLYGGMISVLLLHAAWLGNNSTHRLLVSLTMLPLIRLLSYSLPLRNFPLIYWYLIVSIPLLITIVLIPMTLKLAWHDIGFYTKGAIWQLLIGAGGLILGVVQYYILRPQPIVTHLTLSEIWIPILILMICTGVLEEAIFRGLLLRTASDALGAISILYTALLYTALYVGHASTVQIAFVMAVSLLFGWFSARTRSTLGVAIAHGLINVMCFIVLPLALH